LRDYRYSETISGIAEASDDVDERALSAIDEEDSVAAALLAPLSKFCVASRVA
jgi:hypothetical protein